MEVWVETIGVTLFFTWPLVLIWVVCLLIVFKR